MAGASSLYDEDFVLWSKEQAEALRAAARGGSNEPLDFENLAEEIEDLGKSTRRELMSRLLVVLEHLLKLEHSTATEPRAGWEETIERERSNIEDLLEESPSLRGDLPSMIDKARSRAARLAARSLGSRGEAGAELSPPPYSVEEVLGDWFREEPEK